MLRSSLFFMFIGALLLSSCQSQRHQQLAKEMENQRADLKSLAFCECVKQGYKSAEVKDDVSTGIYNDNLTYGNLVIDSVIAVARRYADSIQPIQHQDYNNQKAILGSCLYFYNSRYLDSMVRSFDGYFNEKTNACMAIKR